MLTPANRLLVEFVLEYSADESAAKRIALYRALAATMSETDETFARLTQLADELEAADESHAQLLLNFRGSMPPAPAKPTVIYLERERPSWWRRLLARLSRIGGAK